MDAIKRIVGAVLILVSMLIAVLFIAWRLYDSADVWTIANIVSLVSIAVAFYFNLERKRISDGSGDNSVTREYLEANALYYATIVLATLFLFNWLNLRVNGIEAVGDDVVQNVVWVVVDILLIVVLWATGGHLLRHDRSR